MEHHVAEQVLTSLLDACQKINMNLVLIQRECTVDEFRAYRLGTGRVLAEIYSEFLDPILKEHPDLEPEEMKRAENDPPER